MRKFAAGQMKCANAPQSWIRPSYCIPAGTPEEEKSQLTLMSTYGNCDPVESNPPPGPWPSSYQNRKWAFASVSERSFCLCWT